MGKADTVISVDPPSAFHPPTHKNIPADEKSAGIFTFYSCNIYSFNLVKYAPSKGRVLIAILLCELKIRIVTLALYRKMWYKNIQKRHFCFAVLALETVKSFSCKHLSVFEIVK